MKTFALAVCCILVGSVASAPAQSKVKTAARFAVTVDGVPVTGVQSVQGLESQSSPVEQKTIGKGSKVPGAARQNRIVITRGMSANDVLLQWHQKAKSAPKPRTMVVTLMNANDERVRTFTFHRCWPERYSSQSLGAGSSGVAIEKLSVVCASEQ